jgi:hypothetical protein
MLAASAHAERRRRAAMVTPAPATRSTTIAAVMAAGTGDPELSCEMVPAAVRSTMRSDVLVVEAGSVTACVEKPGAEFVVDVGVRAVADRGTVVGGATVVVTWATGAVAGEAVETVGSAIVMVVADGGIAAAGQIPSQARLPNANAMIEPAWGR